MLAEKGETAALRGSGHEAQGLARAAGRPHAALVQFDSAAALRLACDGALARWEWRALGPSLGLPVGDTSAHTEAVRQLSRLADGPGLAGRPGRLRRKRRRGETPSPRFGGKRASSRQRPSGTGRAGYARESDAGGFARASRFRAREDGSCSESMPPDWSATRSHAPSSTSTAAIGCSPRRLDGGTTRLALERCLGRGGVAARRRPGR